MTVLSRFKLSKQLIDHCSQLVNVQVLDTLTVAGVDGGYMVYEVLDESANPLPVVSTGDVPIVSLHTSERRRQRATQCQVFMFVNILLIKINESADILPTMNKLKNTFEKVYSN